PLLLFTQEEEGEQICSPLLSSPRRSFLEVSFPPCFYGKLSPLLFFLFDLAGLQKSPLSPKLTAAIVQR
ncbi:hypothetical protein, partial [Paenibacillus sp. GbtcB18]|uniref:hypothetical protein n=1 Tax=Paenibacillus sp. GbtcB18 TaxID=2824763 RepID=UPI001C311095